MNFSILKVTRMRRKYIYKKIVNAERIILDPGACR